MAKLTKKEVYDWQADDDARTLMQVEEIKRNEKRYNKALKALAKIEEEYSERANVARKLIKKGNK